MADNDKKYFANLILWAERRARSPGRISSLTARLATVLLELTVLPWRISNLGLDQEVFSLEDCFGGPHAAGRFEQQAPWCE